MTVMGISKTSEKFPIVEYYVRGLHIVKPEKE